MKEANNKRFWNYTYSSFNDFFLLKYFKHETEDNRDFMTTGVLQYAVAIFT